MQVSESYVRGNQETAPHRWVDALQGHCQLGDVARYGGFPGHGGVLPEYDEQRLTSSAFHLLV